MTFAIYDGSGVIEASSSHSAGEQESSNPNVAAQKLIPNRLLYLNRKELCLLRLFGSPEQGSSAVFEFLRRVRSVASLLFCEKGLREYGAHPEGKIVP
ncbi:unnamed protein product [Lupinus luteus]|uniref:Uncharacterized protein n=1 Tax=Lupinus luteus TaxID=3873 RepID=A0AAV1Y7L3_LUPLU